jgi:hypothetical protein
LNRYLPVFNDNYGTCCYVGRFSLAARGGVGEKFCVKFNDSLL